MISDKVLYRVKYSYFGLRPPLMLAIGVEVHDDWVGFHDTNRGHQFFGKLVKETKDGFVWHRVEDTLEEGRKDFGIVEFKALSLEEYDKKVRPNLIGPIPEFNSTEELYEFYRPSSGAAATTIEMVKIIPEENRGWDETGSKWWPAN